MNQHLIHCIYNFGAQFHNTSSAQAQLITRIVSLTAVSPLVFGFQAELLGLAPSGRNLCSAFGLNNKNMEVGKKLFFFLMLESIKYSHCGPSTFLGTEDTAGGLSSASCLSFLLTATLVAFDEPQGLDHVIKRDCTVFSSCSEITTQLKTVMLPSKGYQLQKLRNTLYYCSQLYCQLTQKKFVFLMQRVLISIPSFI